MPPLPPVSRVTVVATILKRKARATTSRRALERRLDDREAEARVLLPGREVEERERRPARGRDAVRVALEAPQEPLEAAHALDEQEGDQAEDGPEQDRQRHDRPVPQERQVLVEGRDRGARPADEVGHDAGHEAGEEHRVLDPAEVEDLDAEEGARDRRAEHRGEPGPDPADHEATPVLVVEPEDVGEEARDRGADLRARPLLADRAAEGEREHRGQELDRGDPPVDLARPRVDRGDDRLRPVPLRRGREGADEPDAGGQRQRQEEVRAEGPRGRRRPTSRDDAASDQRKARVPQPTHTPATAPSSAHFRVVTTSAACSVYHRPSSDRRGGSGSAEGLTAGVALGRRAGGRRRLSSVGQGPQHRPRGLDLIAAGSVPRAAFISGLDRPGRLHVEASPGRGEPEDGAATVPGVAAAA